MKKQFWTWLDGHRRTIVARLAGNDPAKALRLYAGALLGAGFVLGCLLATLIRAPASLIVLLAAGGAGYAARAFVSYRRREAARQRWLDMGGRER